MIGFLNGFDGWVPPCPYHPVPRIRCKLEVHPKSATTLHTSLPILPAPEPTFFAHTFSGTDWTKAFIGIGKYTQLQEVILRLPQGICCLQDTKSTHTNILKLSHSHIYVSGSSDDPHAGEGFAIPTPLLPIVYDFHPWNSRIAVLVLNTRPHRVAWFSIYAPSTIQDPTSDIHRKHQFWDQLHNVFNHYKPKYIPIPMGDFNTRPCSNQIEGLQSHIGPATFSTDIDDDLLQATNLSSMIGFLQDNELSVISSMRPRQPSQLVTYLEISNSPPPVHSATIDTFAVLSQYSTTSFVELNTRLISAPSNHSVPLPWFHRHFLLSTKLQLPFFTNPRSPSPPPPKRDFTSTDSKLEYQVATLKAFKSLAPCHIYTDGSCPDQDNVSPHNITQSSRMGSFL